MKDKLSFIASFVPLIVLMAVGYVVPVISNVIGSMQDKQGGFVGLDNWATVLTSYYFIDSLLFTLKVALVSTALAMVIAVGPGGNVDGKEITMHVAAGQKVIYSKYAGTEVKVDGEELIIVRQSDILAIVE